jgi:polyisoprenoid-binding protein YceI
MFTRRKPLAGLAALTAALAVAVPASTASAATPTVDPTVCELINTAQGPFGPAMFIGGASLKATLQTAGGSVGCAPAPAPQGPAALLPIGP